MKKQQYIQPETIVVFIKSTSILDGSSPTKNTYDGGDDIYFDPNDMEGGNGGDAASRRRNSVWDEE